MSTKDRRGDTIHPQGSRPRPFDLWPTVLRESDGSAQSRALEGRDAQDAIIVGSTKNLARSNTLDPDKAPCGALLRNKEASSARVPEGMRLYCLLIRVFFGAVFALFGLRSRPPIRVNASSALNGN